MFIKLINLRIACKPPATRFFMGLSPEYRKEILAMTREEKIAKMQELRAEADKNVKLYNDAYQQEKFSDAKKIEVDLNKNIDDYGAYARTVCYDDCKESGDPMMAAIKALTYSTIATKDDKVGESKDTQVIVRSIIDVDKPIDLLKLHKYCGGIGKNAEWPYLIEKFNMLMTAQKAIDLGIDPKSISDSYAMSKIAAEKNMGKTPTSKTNILKTLQIVVTAMIGEEYKALSHDVNYLLSIYSKKSRKALTVVCANHRYMRNYMAEICHRIVTGKTYNVEYKAKKV
jgi:hypothetical protein